MIAMQRIIAFTSETIPSDLSPVLVQERCGNYCWCICASKRKIRKLIETGADDWAAESWVACFDLIWDCHTISDFPYSRMR